eukprot:TRINITY_DN5605_c0_g1_i6.p1 TRINITY_DN5605_c0_g1~~TRINITY_DN5605_c0_g1_i6.p1  ORF type:complete len:258 (-),score=47.94 TRINITY_DN5605_c0_g1_i6:352-1086(-)
MGSEISREEKSESELPKWSYNNGQVLLNGRRWIRRRENKNASQSLSSNHHKDINTNDDRMMQELSISSSEDENHDEYDISSSPYTTSSNHSETSDSESDDEETDKSEPDDELEKKLLRIPYKAEDAIRHRPSKESPYPWPWYVRYVCEVKKDCLDKLQKQRYFEKDNLRVEVMSYIAHNFQEAFTRHPTRSSLEIQVMLIKAYIKFKISELDEEDREDAEKINRMKPNEKNFDLPEKDDDRIPI